MIIPGLKLVVLAQVTAAMPEVVAQLARVTPAAVRVRPLPVALA
jgi:hypothetical protein